MKDEIKEFNEEMYVEMIEDGTLYDYITNLQEENERLHNIIKEVREYNEQIIKDTKDFYRPTEDIIYSGDCLIDIATQNLEILDKENDNETI